MEPWKEELYHYGIKGMKWRKRKKMSDLESAGRNFEINARREDAIVDSIWEELYKEPKDRDDAKLDRLQSAYNRAVDHTNLSSDRLRPMSKKIIKKIQKKDPKKRLVDKGTIRNDKIVLASGSWHNVTGTNEAKKRAERKTTRKVKAYNAKYKAKTFIKNLFKKKKG